MDMKDFINRAEFRTDPHHGVIATFDGKDYEVAPDGDHHVRVLDEDGETIGRLTVNRSGQFVPS